MCYNFRKFIDRFPILKEAYDGHKPEFPEADATLDGVELHKRPADLPQFKSKFVPFKDYWDSMSKQHPFKRETPSGHPEVEGFDSIYDHRGGGLATSTYTGSGW
jgi:hypothetical protein